MVDVFLPSAQKIAGQSHRGFDGMQFAVEDADGFAGHLVIGQPQLHQPHFGSLDRQFGGADVGGDGAGFQNGHRVLFRGHAPAENGVMHPGVNVRQESVIQHSGPADGQRFVE